MQKKWLRYVIIGLCLLALVLIRAIGKELFYDPLLAFFHLADFQSISLPTNIDLVKLSGSMVFRYSLNSLFSVIILLQLFRQNQLRNFLILLYSSALLLLLGVFIYLFHHAEPGNYLSLFYVRRIIMHPVLLLVLAPALYFQQASELKKKNN